MLEPGRSHPETETRTVCFFTTRLCACLSPAPGKAQHLEHRRAALRRGPESAESGLAGSNRKNRVSCVIRVRRRKCISCNAVLYISTCTFIRSARFAHISHCDSHDIPHTALPNSRGTPTRDSARLVQCRCVRPNDKVQELVGTLGLWS